MYRIRPFEPQDAAEFFSDFTRLFPHFPVTEENFFRKTFLDLNFDPAGVFYLLRDGKKVGMTYAQVRRIPYEVGEDVSRTPGTLSFFRVAEEVDLNDGGAELLLTAAEDFLRTKGKDTVRACGGTCFFHSGFDVSQDSRFISFFQAHGYAGGDHLARRIDLTNYQMPEKLREKQRILAAEGIYTGSLTRELYLSFLSPRPSAPYGWLNQYRKRLLFAPTDLARVQVAARGFEVIGATMFGDPDSDMERFGPFGVNEDERGRGIGSVLLALCLQEMHRRGLRSAWMMSSPAKGAACTVYERAGFRETGRYTQLDKKLI